MVKKLKRISMLALAAVMCVSMMIGMNVRAADEPAADEAQIKVGKTLTINGKKWPNIEKFDFELEAVSGYTNPNVSTAVDGQVIPANNVPMPAGAANNKVTKSVGDFRTNATDAGNNKAKTRTDVFGNIKYTTAGYYLYKMKEVIPENKVSGVYYDESTYYVVVYVVNNIDSQGNTIDGVHVESVTAWHNAKGSDANKPNLKDIANKGYTSNHDATTQENDDNTGDNNGQAAKDHSTYGGQDATGNPNNEQRWDDLGKVGKSTPPDPDDPNNGEGDSRNKLDAYKFWNRQEMHDIYIKKNVKGNLGDVTKQFEFTVTLTKLEGGGTYSIEKIGTKYKQTTGAAAKGDNTGTKYYTKEGNVYTEVTDKTTLADDAVVFTIESEPTLVSATVGNVNNSSNQITADANGNCTFLVKMTDDQGIKLEDIPNLVTYKVNEAASNHAPAYKITSDSNAPEYVYNPITVAEAKDAEPTNPPTVYYATNDGTDTVADLSSLNDEDTVYVKVKNPDAPIIVKPNDNTAYEKTTGAAAKADTSNKKYYTKANNAYSEVEDKTTLADDAVVYTKNSEASLGEKELPLATAVETVDPSDGNITIAYTNTRNLETITGIPDMAIYFGIAGLIALIALIAIRKRKDDGLVEF